MGQADVEWSLLWTKVLCRTIDITSEDWVRLNHGSSLSGTSIPDFSTINQQASEFSLFYEPGSSHKRLKVGRSNGLGDIKCCKRGVCSGNSATQEEGSSPSYFRSLRTMLLSIAIPNECHSSKNTTPKLYMSAFSSIFDHQTVFHLYIWICWFKLSLMHIYICRVCTFVANWHILQKQLAIIICIWAWNSSVWLTNWNNFR